MSVTSAQRPVIGRSQLGRDLARAAERVLLIALPVALSAWCLHLTLSQHNFALDFDSWFRPAGMLVLHGRSPYALPTARAFDYPALSALMFVPFALMPKAVATWLFAVAVVACVPLTLRVLSVRDWRVYAAVMLWQPVIVGWEFANVSLPLMLGVAVAWRYRDRPAISGILVAIVISIKIFLLPLGVWLLATRRYRALAWGTGVGGLANGIAWLVVGPGQISVYLRLLHRFTPSAEHRGYSVIAFVIRLGAGHALAYASGLGLAGAAILIAVVLGGPDRDRHLLTASLLASLLASPLVDAHYLAVLVVPLAIASPCWRLAWALPAALLIAPADHPRQWERGVSIVVCLIVVAATVRRPPSRATVGWPSAATAGIAP